MSSCLAVETFFRSPARGGPGAWRAPGWDMNGGSDMIGMRKMMGCEGNAPGYGTGAGRARREKGDAEHPAQG